LHPELKNNQMKLKRLQQTIFLQLSSSLGEGEARAVVRLLFEYFTGYDNLYINLNPQTEIASHIVDNINIAASQLLENKPIQYVLGETVFCKLPFIVTDAVLIPRSETEELTRWIIEENKQINKLLDICTGSGCIAVSLAKNIKKCEVYAVEISSESLKIAQKNAELNNVKVNFTQYDIFNNDFFRSTDIKFDIIVSNPPYVREMEKRYMHKRVLDYEPYTALFVDDEQPLLFYDIILKFGQTHLVNNGKLYFEINEHFSKEITDLYAKYGYTNIRLKQDIHGKDRMLCGEW
jgi:release factor glutamine methyltransferase